MNNGSMLKPALTGGVALGILSAIPVISNCNCVCCAWAIGGGILASYLYVRESEFTVTMGRGVLAGLAAGVIGAVVCTLFSIPIQLISGAVSQSMFVEQINEQLAKNPDMPYEARQMIEELLLRPDLMRLIAVFGFFSNVVFFSLFAMVGGAIGVAIFEKRKPGGEQANVIPPPPQPPEDTQPPEYL